MKFEKPWQEVFVDHMGLIVALDGQHRFSEMEKLKAKICALSEAKQIIVKECLRQRFTPTNGENGCQGGTAAVKSVLEESGAL